ncbi:MAG: helix-turn-helix domain-containing protein [Eubacterium sp.]|nr:helix-turn-helix domain-containing protein [Eubacterium sp.]
MTDLDFKTIGANIKKRRTCLGITQETIANVLDVNPSHISNIECGRANPSLTVLVKIANILQCSVDVFISGEYTFQPENSLEQPLDELILEKLKSCSTEKKSRVLKMIDLL